MAMKQIVTVPDSILVQECEKVTFPAYDHQSIFSTSREKVGKKYDNAVKDLIKDLLDTVKNAKEPEAAGLAAPQIGVSKRVCVVRNFIQYEGEKEVASEYVLVNPKIYSHSKEIDVAWEGCLSIPDTYGQVERYKKIKVKALDENGQEIRLSASGFFARVIQHEVDHLDGILFTSKVIGKTLTEVELDNLYTKVTV